MSGSFICVSSKYHAAFNLYQPHQVWYIVGDLISQQISLPSALLPPCQGHSPIHPINLRGGKQTHHISTKQHHVKLKFWKRPTMLSISTNFVPSPPSGMSGMYAKRLASRGWLAPLRGGCPKGMPTWGGGSILESLRHVSRSGFSGASMYHIITLSHHAPPPPFFISLTLT